MEWLIGAAAHAGASLFKYNREGFKFDQHVRMWREVQIMQMQIKQFELYREDVRDLVDLTVVKMDKYMIVNTLQLGFCITLFTEGRPEEGRAGTPGLIWLIFGCNVGAFLYYLLSMWLAMHASIAAHSFGVRMLTQFVRLPVPTSMELDAARSLAQEYEGTQLREILRIPLWKQQMKRLNAAMTDMHVDDCELVHETGDPTSQVTSLQHVQLFRQLQANWQSYDAYSRVCMALGTSQFLMAVAYKSLELLIADTHDLLIGICSVLIFITCSWILARFDLYLSRKILFAAGALLVSPVVLSAINIVFYKSTKGTGKAFLYYRIVLAIVVILHIIWIVFTTAVAKANQFNEVFLPTKFRSVLYLDVFGWLSQREHGGGYAGTHTNQEQANLSTVMEESTAARGGADGGLPPSLRALLVAECRGLRADVQQDLSRWESPEVASLLEYEPATMEAIGQLRRRYEAAMEEGTRVEEDSSSQLPSPDADMPPQSIVWLKLEWNPYGTPMEYFYCCETGEYLWDEPEPSSRISEVWIVEQQLEALIEKLEMLQRGAQRSDFSPPGQHPDQDVPATRAGGPIGEPARSGELVDVSNHLSSASLGTDASLLEGRFGGHEAIDLRERGSGSTFYGHDQDTSATFHPVCEVHDPDRLRYKPGQIPWRTVMQGSMVLLMAWLFVLGLLTANIITGQNWKEFPDEFFEPRLLDRFQPVRVNSWPHPFFRLTGLACHPRLGPMVLASEKYAVHRLDLEVVDGDSSARVSDRPMLAPCLEQALSFLGRGLADISVGCSEALGGDCSAVILGADGRSALLCSLDQGNSRKTPTRIDIFGGQWRSLATSTLDMFWALGDEGPVQLSPQWTPQLDLGHPAGARLTRLHVLGGHTVLGLAGDGRLYAWSLRDGAKFEWLLPGHVAWNGVCVTGDRLLLAGIPDGNRTAGLWQAEVPWELAALTAPTSTSITTTTTMATNATTTPTTATTTTTAKP